LIVEYKNRRARKDAGSLWGDIDLKAIARAVDEDDPATPAVAPPTSSVKQQPLRVRGKRPPLSVNAAVSSQPSKAADSVAASSEAKRKPVVLSDVAPEAPVTHINAERESLSPKPVTKQEASGSAQPSEGTQIAAEPLVSARKQQATPESKPVDDGLAVQAAVIQLPDDRSAAALPAQMAPGLPAEKSLPQTERIAVTSKKQLRNSSKTVLKPRRDASVPVEFAMATDADTVQRAVERSSAVITNEMLAALTAENVRLKKLLTKQLRVENQKLKQMLVRTD